MNDLKLKINKVLEGAEKGVRAETDEPLKELYSKIIEEPMILWNDSSELINLAKCCILMIHYDIFDNEPTEIRIAHLAYTYNTRALDIEKDKKEASTEPFDTEILKSALRERIILMEHYSEYLLHTIAAFYQKNPLKVSREDLKQSLELAKIQINYLISYDLLNYEMYEKDFSGDKYLTEISNRIEANVKPDKSRIKEASFIHFKLNEYIAAKIEDLDYKF